MSAIFGIVRLDGGSVDPAPARRMAAALAHRGAGVGVAVRAAAEAVLGHFPTPTTLETRCGNRPGTLDGDLRVVADARLDHRGDLLRELRAAGAAAPAEADDAELILHAYRCWGAACPQRLEGDFAFVVWDARARRLLGARDRMGVRPFFFHRRPDFFAFASEIKALLCIPGLPRRLQECMVADYLANTLRDAALTWYRDLSRLPPARVVEAEPGRMTVRRYWSLDPSARLQLRSDADYARAYRCAFTAAVEACLRTAPRHPEPVLGAMLSGGLDSSSIVCVARARLEAAGAPPLHTFSSVYEQLAACDERRYIGAVTDGGALCPHFVPGDRDGPLGGIAELRRVQDEPCPVENLFQSVPVYRAARGWGARVLLDGYDGDAVVSLGFDLLTRLACTGRWRRLWREARALERHLGGTPRDWILHYGLRPMVPSPLLRLRRRLRRRAAPGSARESIVRAEFARRVPPAEPVDDPPAAELRTAARSHRGYHFQQLAGSGYAPALEAAGMAAAFHGVEPRYPFFDRRLMELCLSLPPEQKLRDGLSRHVARVALADLLPPPIRGRGGKTDFSLNFRRGLASRDAARVERALARDLPAAADYVDPAAVRRAWDRFLREGRNADAVDVWRAVELAGWFARTAPGS